MRWSPPSEPSEGVCTHEGCRLLRDRRTAVSCATRTCPIPSVTARGGAHRGRGDQHRGRRHAQPRPAEIWRGSRTSWGTSRRARSAKSATVSRDSRWSSGLSRPASGSHAEKVAAPSVITWPIPDGGDIIDARAFPVAFGTADDCLFEFGHLTKGETVLIQAGAGGVGVAAIQLAKRAGVTVFRDGVEPWTGSRHSSISGSITGRLLEGRLGRRGPRPDGRPRCRPRRRLGRRDDLQQSLAVLAYRGRCITVGGAGRGVAAALESPACDRATSPSSAIPRRGAGPRPACTAWSAASRDVAAGRCVS